MLDAVLPELNESTPEPGRPNSSCSACRSRSSPDWPSQGIDQSRSRSRRATLPDALAGRDVLGRGRTGSGKTLAFGLPLLARLAGSTARPRATRWP